MVLASKKILATGVLALTATVSTAFPSKIVNMLRDPDKVDGDGGCLKGEQCELMFWVFRRRVGADGSDDCCFHAQEVSSGGAGHVMYGQCVFLAGDRGGVRN